MPDRSSSAVVVLGAGGHAKVVIATAHAAGQTVVGVLDDEPSTWGTTILGVRVEGDLGNLPKFGKTGAVIAVGSNAARARIAEKLPEASWSTLVHPRAVVDPTARLGPGTVVFAGAVIQPDVSVGSHAIINTSASIDHDCTIADFVHLAPGTHLAGGIRIGTGAFLGIGAVVIPGRRIGQRAIVGAGACVVRDVADDETVVGVPARVIARV